jgi:hypothetical protein
MITLPTSAALASRIGVQQAQENAWRAGQTAEMLLLAKVALDAPWV